MPKPEIILESPITLAELKEELAKIKKRDGELNFRANKTEDYLNNFIEDTDLKKAKEVKKSIEELNVNRLKPEHIVKIVDLMPKTIEELKVIMQAYTLTLTQDQLKKIVDAINS